DLLIRHIDLLREVIRHVKQHHPFEIIAMVVMPDHLHTIWQLPPDDSDYPLRWSLIKAGFSRKLAKTERIRESRVRKRERGIWQRHYWEHLIRDEQDYRHHMDYVHINPLKHGHVTRVADWPYSTFHRYVASGVYPLDWCGSVDGVLGALE
ncbi:REP-associated tyrosine transposase, partial [Aeromonas veronii]|uniref:REP-associated tyrosine transposase n=1 Tax=Aeromonas veronii TaxID=654 RepID=UPI003F74673B